MCFTRYSELQFLFTYKIFPYCLLSNCSWVYFFHESCFSLSYSSPVPEAREGNGGCGRQLCLSSSFRTAINTCAHLFALSGIGCPFTFNSCGTVWERGRRLSSAIHTQLLSILLRSCCGVSMGSTAVGCGGGFSVHHSGGCSEHKDFSYCSLHWVMKSLYSLNYLLTSSKASRSGFTSIIS